MTATLYNTEVWIGSETTKDTIQTSLSTSSLILQLLEEIYSMHGP